MTRLLPRSQPNLQTRGLSAIDPEAGLMKTGEGTIRLCYNAQVVVDNRQLIVVSVAIVR